MTLPGFDLLRPRTLDEALDMLSVGEKVRPIAGGTNLIVDMRSGKVAPSTLVDVGGLHELCCIRVRDGVLSIGSGVTIAELLDDPMVDRHTPMLQVMARSFANTLIRNRATIGGNLVNAAPCSDTAPALLVLDAEVELASRDGARRMPLDEFLVGGFETKRQATELLTCVRVPIPPASTRTAFEKMGLRKISCMAKVDVAVRVDLGNAGSVTNAQVAVGASSAVALRVLKAENVLVESGLSTEAITQASDFAAAAAEPRAGSEYKRQVVRGMTRRLLTSLCEGAGNG